MTAAETAPSAVNAPLGLVEPHAGLLKAPAPGQQLYKLMSVENLLRSVAGSYLHFNRVDHYRDFSDADPFDGAELPLRGEPWTARDRDGLARGVHGRRAVQHVAGP